MSKTLQIIDLFCGAGGFSEGFRQQGFEIVMGIDNWPLAVETHNLNHNLKDKAKDVLKIGASIEQINGLPNTEVIVGSPPCVLFSHSNNGGNSDKTDGVKLIESFLRIVAVKKYQPSSKLLAWFMENVPNSKNYVQGTYSFRQLNLVDWAIEKKIDPDETALTPGEHGEIVDTADFGTPQKRKRFLCGEIVATGRFPDLKPFKVEKHRSVNSIRSKMPQPNSYKPDVIYTDPNYSSLKFTAENITDHFYDSGIYECQWRDAKWLKTNHPYMGKMSFPENEDKPSRTVMATQSASTREALIYKSEYNREGDGQYRLPTIREVATIMGFPYTYQFLGGENNKWRQVGNAVSPHLSSALAKSVRLVMSLKIISDSEIKFCRIDSEKLADVENLNNFQKTVFDNPPKKNLKAAFRRHAFKDGNMTVALTNFDPNVKPHKPSLPIKWFSSLFFGAGKDFGVNVVPRNSYENIGKLILDQHQTQGRRFLDKFQKKFHEVIGHSNRFQAVFTGQENCEKLNPRSLVDEIGKLIEQCEPDEKLMKVPNWISGKEIIPTKQVLAIYAINRIIS